MLSVEDKPKANISLPVKKKAKNERGTIMSFFNTKKSEQNDEPKENKSRNQSKSNKKLKTTVEKQNKIKEDEKPKQNDQIASSVQVEKTSLILFDEV